MYIYTCIYIYIYVCQGSNHSHVASDLTNSYSQIYTIFHECVCWMVCAGVCVRKCSRVSG